MTQSKEILNNTNNSSFIKYFPRLSEDKYFLEKQHELDSSILEYSAFPNKVIELHSLGLCNPKIHAF